ncbi:MAG: sensor histidine kinase [Epsilonproteobacteria bacterium]|nr:MAG: sensor histidine kinase [Campylobacterota bacterium]
MNQDSELQELKDRLSKIEEQLISSEKMASLGTLVAGVTHELSTPIGLGVTGMSHFISETKQLRKLFENQEMTQNDFENYLKDTQKMADIVYTNLLSAKNTIQSFKRISVDQSSEVKREFLLHEYIDEIITSLHNRIKHTHIDLQNQIDQKIELNSYPSAFAQIFTNFIMNSLIHAFKENEHGTIVISATQDNKNIYMEYKDDGAGIPSDIINKIYEPFFTTRGDKGGSGLGMQIIHELITKKLNGNIEVISSLGNGTTFNISIPKVIL